jgi:hypothetical protein
MAPPRFPESDLGDRRVSPPPARADDPPMPVMTLPSPVTASATIRCECASCGAHVEVRRSWQISGQCGNCRSYDLRPLVSAPPTPPATPMARLDLVPRRPVAFLAARVA